MDEHIQYSSEEEMRKVSSAGSFNRGQSSGASAWGDPSRIFVQFKNFHLNLLQKLENPSDRPIIPSTKAERYSYYRSISASPARCLIFGTTISNSNVAIWTYLLNGLFKSYPHTFTNLFLASYSPEEHLFLPKMLPFFYGTKFAIIIASICNFQMSLNHMILTLGYLVNGVMYKSPWNRCSIALNDTSTCLDARAFAAKVRNSTWRFKRRFYQSANGDKFQLVQLKYFKYFVDKILNRKQKALYVLIVWSVIVSLHRLVLHRRSWKIQHKLQLTTLVIEGICFSYMIYSGFSETDVPESTIMRDVEMNTFMAKSDIEFMSESIAAPPVVHVLTARSTQDILPTQDSFLIFLSNTAFGFFRIFLIRKLKCHCKNMVGAPLQMTKYNPFSWMFLWPLFFSQFYWGEVYTILFYAIGITGDIMSLIISYRCLLEVIVFEWTFVREWMVDVIAPVISILTYVFAEYPNFIHMYLCTTGFTNLVEVIGVYYLYPVGRFIDDVIFHFGYPPTKIEQILWRLTPPYYFVKMYLMLDAIYNVRKNKQNYFVLTTLEWCVVWVPYVFGIIYVAYKYISSNTQNWSNMFVPKFDWGPRDHQVRQMRKEFNSHTFIRSQADRHLSRYMIVQQEAKVYQLNVNYNPKRRSTVSNTRYRMETEKKD